MEQERLTELCGVIDTLLGENGCAWDKAQTFESLKPHLLEECYEAAEAIDKNDKNSLQDELGDLMLHIIMYSRIAAKDKSFSLEDVFAGASKKLIRRHTHIFGSDTAETPSDVVGIWDANKLKEKALSTAYENMLDVPKALPALMRAQKVIKRSGRDFNENELKNEIHKLLDNTAADDTESYGKLLFLVSAYLTKMQINAEISLTNATLTFINSFKDK